MGTKFVVQEQDLLMVMQIALKHMLKDDTLAAPLMERLTTSVKSYLHEECERIEDGKRADASLDEVITKRAAIDALDNLCLYPGEWAVNGLGLCKDAIANLPSIDIEYIIASHEEIGYERGLRDGYAQAVTESEATEQWIPCSERLPETEVEVLCCDNQGDMIIGHPYVDKESWTGYSAEGDDDYLCSCVAWMPLPEPVRGEENVKVR